MTTEEKIKEVISLIGIQCYDLPNKDDLQYCLSGEYKATEAMKNLIASEIWEEKIKILQEILHPDAKFSDGERVKKNAINKLLTLMEEGKDKA